MATTAGGDMVVRMRKVLAIPRTTELVRVLQCLIYRIPVFVSGTWILDSNRLWDPGFLELFSGLQSQGFWIPQAKFSRIPKFEFPHMRRLVPSLIRDIK